MNSDLTPDFRKHPFTPVRLVKMPVVFEKVNEKAEAPVYSTEGSAGADLKACLEEMIVIDSGERALIPTGLKIKISEGYEAQIRPRSGLALKKGLTVLNTPGTIDSDYRGELGVILFNTSQETVFIEHGDRIAQIVFNKVEIVDFVEGKVDEDTDRGSGGFGSTGIGDINEKRES